MSDTATPTTTADGLRALADWIEAHPGLADHIRVAALAYPIDTPETVAAWARAMGSAKKEYADTLFSLIRDFGGVELTATFWRSTVCRKVVTGTVHIPAETIPARVIEAHEQEIVEWVCDDPILSVAS